MLLVGNPSSQVGCNIVDDLAGGVDTAGKSAVVAVAAFEISAGVECRVLGVDLNDATGRVEAEQCSLRAFENIDAGYGAQLKDGRIPVRDINVIEINGDGAFLAGAVRAGSDPANERRRPVDFVPHLHAGNELRKLIRIEGSGAKDGIRGDRDDGNRNFLGIFYVTLGRHGDFHELVGCRAFRSAFRRVRVGRGSGKQT